MRVTLEMKEKELLKKIEKLHNQEDALKLENSENHRYLHGHLQECEENFLNRDRRTISSIRCDIVKKEISIKNTERKRLEKERELKIIRHELHNFNQKLQGAILKSKRFEMSPEAQEIQKNNLKIKLEAKHQRAIEKSRLFIDKLEAVLIIKYGLQIKNEVFEAAKEMDI